MANIVRWDDPFAGLTNLHSQLDDMFNAMFSGVPAMQMPQTSMPAMDVYSEDDKSLVLDVQVPGFKKDEVDISVHNGILEIKGEKHEKEEDKKGNKRSYMLRESHASFYRRLRLPDYADEEHVDAKFEGGMLKITVPFKELPKPKKVAISEDSKK
jgi:HSP20 family protein